MNAPRISYRKILALIIVLLFLSACSSVRLISDYDEVTDRSLTAIQRKTADFIDFLEKNYQSEAAGYERNIKFYNEMNKMLRTLEFRVNAIPDNSRTVALVRNIRLVILGDKSAAAQGSLQDLHRLPQNRERGISPAVLKIARRNIDQAISAALSLEIAKKRGLKK